MSIIACMKVQNNSKQFKTLLYKSKNPVLLSSLTTILLLTLLLNTAIVNIENTTLDEVNTAHSFVS